MIKFRKVAPFQLLSAAFFLGIVSLSPASAQESASTVSTETTQPEEMPALIPTEAFAGRAAFWNASLSPDGTVLTLLQPVGDKVQLTAFDPRTRQAINAVNLTKGSHVEWSRWIDNERMLMSVRGIGFAYGWPVPTTRIFIVHPKKGRADPLIDEQSGFDGGQLLHISEDKNSVLLAHAPPDLKARGTRSIMQKLFSYEPGVYRYELKPGGRVDQVLEPENGIDSWVTDDAGVIRLGLGWRRKRLSIFYRDNEAQDFRRIARIKESDTEGFFEAIKILSGSSRGFILDENDAGRVGLRLFDYDTREVVETYYENPDWDVEDVWLDEDGNPVAAFYTDDRQRAVWFDDEYKAAHSRLSKALGEGEVWIVSRSENGRQMLVSASNEADPGVLYFYDADARQLSEFAQFRPEIDFRLLAWPKAITYPARDGTQIRAYLTLPKGREPRNLPLVIFPHGGPFGIRDQLIYDDHVQLLANRGYAVLQPNFRGSGGYGPAFYDLGVGQVGRGMQDDLDDAMDWAVGQNIADPARVCLAGASYGGYAALWGVLRNPERYRCAASWAGVTDWTRMLKYDRRVMTRQAGKRWSAKIEGDDKDFDLKDFSPYRLAKSLRRPVLLAHGTADDNVPFEQYEQMLDAAEDAPVKLTTLVIKGEGHGFSNSANEQQWYDALDQFLAKHNPADQVLPDGSMKPGTSSSADPAINGDEAAE